MLAAVVSENRKFKGLTRCSLFSWQRTLLTGWLTELTDGYRQIKTVQSTRTQTGQLRKKYGEQNSTVNPEAEVKSVIYVVNLKKPLECYHCSE
jgi:hypothetical protein